MLILHVIIACRQMRHVVAAAAYVDAAYVACRRLRRYDFVADFMPMIFHAFTALSMAMLSAFARS